MKDLRWLKLDQHASSDRLLDLSDSQGSDFTEVIKMSPMSSIT